MLRPPPQLTVSAWADRHRVLSSRASSEPGPWRTSRTPYLRDIMDALSAVHPARRVVFMKGAQVGASEGGNCWLGYILHHVPAPVLAVQPTVELAKRFSRQRIDPLLEETPALKERVAPARARDSGNTLLSKEFPGGILVLTGANSAVGLRSMTARFLFLDEIDAYPGDVEGEGDPIALAEARARTFGWRRKAFLVSTPTISGRSRIEREYAASDQRRYFVPCPHCGEMQWLRFERLRWEKGDPRSARYHCEACDAGIEEHFKTAMLAAGEWRPTAVAEDPHAVGFHISALYSPVGWLSWEQIARDWDSAQGKPEDLKTFKNTVLGETWQEQGEAPDWERLVERREDFSLGVVPDGALVLTAGVDVQDDRLECDVWGWAEGFSSWLVDHVVISGSPREREPWDALAQLLARDWPRSGSSAVRIAKACVDTGGRDTAAVYGQLRRLRDPRIAPTKGVDGWNRAQPVQGPTSVDAMVDGRKLRRGLKLWTVSVSTWKADLYRRLWVGRGEADEFPPGWVHLPRAIEVEWVKQLVSEQLQTVKDRRGFARQEWAKLRDRNEALDCAVLARAALWLLGADRYGERFWQRLREDVSNAVAVLWEAFTSSAARPSLPARPETGPANDDPAALVDAMAEALAARSMPGYQPKGSGRHAEFMGWRPSDMVAELLRRRGDRNVPRNPVQLAERAFHTTSDFPLLLSAAANKMLLAAYQPAQPTYRQIFLRRDFRDFKPHRHLRVGDFPTLLPLAENGEIQAGTMSESQEIVLLQTFARRIRVTRPMLVNDDLGAFTDFAAAIGRRVADFENATAYALLNSASGDGPTLATGAAPVFATAAARANKAAAGTALDLANVATGRAAVMRQKTLDGLPIALGSAMRLLVGPNQELPARQLTVAVSATQTSNANVYAGFIQPLVEPLIPANRWYLFADPLATPVYVYGYLNGAEGPQVTTGPVSGVDGVEVSVIFDFGVGAIDYRGAWFKRKLGLYEALVAAPDVTAAFPDLLGPAPSYVVPVLHATNVPITQEDPATMADLTAAGITLVENWLRTQVTHAGLRKSGTEVTAPGYARAAITWSAAGQPMENLNQLDFGTAITDTGINEVAGYTAATGGSAVVVKAIPTQAPSNQVVRLAAGALDGVAA